ncbi:HTH-type transcriptional regulator immR [uncultured Ruminococcus sp.]|nr:helix-turn-helix transcriptional regulator [Hydrogeniiclostridium mannosilyticum]SCH33597.1 HTH-type transcriptional regulator immR [uncultured Ruminococcus sp.]
MVTKKEKEISNLGHILKQARQKMGYTREQLSERVGISLRYLTAIENEQKRPSYDVLYRLLHNLGLSADSIFYPEKESDTEEKQLLRLLQQCSERDRKIVKSVIDALLDNA